MQPVTAKSARLDLVSWALALPMIGCATGGADIAEPGPGASGDCTARIIVAQNAGAAPLTSQDLAALLGSAVERVELVGEITADRQIFVLTAPGPESNCAAAIENLRHDSRIRWVERDARRMPESP